jgi:hypothetical protein
MARVFCGPDVATFASSGKTYTFDSGPRSNAISFSAASSELEPKTALSRLSRPRVARILMFQQSKLSYELGFSSLALLEFGGPIKFRHSATAFSLANTIANTGAL